MSVETYPGFPLITSGILFTIVAHVSSTVAGLATTIVVLGSPSIVHSFLSKSFSITSEIRFEKSTAFFEVITGFPF